MGRPSRGCRDRQHRVHAEPVQHGRARDAQGRVAGGDEPVAEVGDGIDVGHAADTTQKPAAEANPGAVGRAATGAGDPSPPDLPRPQRQRRRRRRSARQAATAPASVASGRWISRSGVSSTTRSDGERPPGRRRRQPRRLHVGGQGALGGQQRRARRRARGGRRRRRARRGRAGSRRPPAPRRAGRSSTRDAGRPAHLAGDHDVAGAQASGDRAAEAGDRDRVGGDARGDQRGGPRPGGAHAGAQHQRSGKPAPHGRALEAKRRDHEQAAGISARSRLAEPACRPPRSQPAAPARTKRRGDNGAAHE